MGENIRNEIVRVFIREKVCLENIMSQWEGGGVSEYKKGCGGQGSQVEGSSMCGRNSAVSERRRGAIGW